MCVSNYSDHIDNGPRNNYEWVYFTQIGIFFLFFNLTNALFSFLLRLRLFFFNKNEDIINTLSHLNSHKRKNNSCMHCMPMILLFVQSTISSFNFVCYDYIKNCFFFPALFGSFVQLNLAHSSFSPLIKFKSCTMLFSSLFDFPVKYLHHCLF